MAVLCEAFVHLYVVFDKSVVNKHADGTHKEYFEFGAAGEKFRVVEQKVHHRKFRLGTAFAGGHPVDDLIFVAVAHNVVGVEIKVDYVVGFGQGGNIVFKFFGFFCRKKSKKPVVKGFERDASDVAEFVGVRGMNVSVKRGDDFPGRKQNRGVFHRHVRQRFAVKFLENEPLSSVYFDFAETFHRRAACFKRDGRVQKFDIDVFFRYGIEVKFQHLLVAKVENFRGTSTKHRLR